MTKEPLPDTIEEKKALLLKHHIAIWDVVQKCDIKGSSDSSIKNVEAADIAGLLNKTGIVHIYANGDTAMRLYNRYCLDTCGVEIIKLPSSSPANAAYSLEKLVEVWGNAFEENGDSLF